jgi:hypothetical protein
MMGPEYHKKRRKERKKMFLALLGNKCENCGSRNNLEFDHKDPSKKEFGVARNINSPDEFVKKEVKKCRLLCNKCHKEKTKKEWDFALPPAKHGSLWMYKEYGCRCAKCKKTMSDYYHSKK